MTAEETAGRINRLDEHNPAAVRLARLVSFASVVDPALLRAARYSFLPHADPGSEADVWFSGLVQARSPQGLVFFAEIADSLRRGLTTDEASAAFALTSRLHATRAMALRLEEQINYLSLDADANRTTIEELLTSATAALVRGARSEIANWAGRAVPRFPPVVQRLGAATMLAVASDLRLGRGSNLRSHLEGHDAIPTWLAELVPPTATVDVGLYVTDAGVEFGPPDRNGQVLRAPATNPIVLELGWDDSSGQHSRLVFAEPGERTAPERLLAETVRVTTLAGEMYTLTAQPGSTAATVANAISLRAHPAAYSVLVSWFAEKPIPGCRGFAVERRTRDTPSEFLSRFEPSSRGPQVRRSTAEAPLQRFTWFHDGADREPASYRVVPVLGGPGSDPEVSTALASNWSDWVQPGPQSAPVSVYFNRGLAFWGTGPTSAAGRDTTVDLQEALAQADRPERAFLGGDLLSRLVAALQSANAEKGQVFAAISELNDPQVLAELAALGKRAHVLLAAPQSSSRRRSSNDDALKVLRHAGVEVVERVTPANRLAHNKFLVVCDVQARPTSVWTGNASWTATGLLVRQNVAIYVQDRAMAAAFLNYWRRLAAAGRGFPRALVDANAREAFVSNPDGTELRAWFAPTSEAPELDFVIGAIAAAKEGMIFVLSEPGWNDAVTEAVGMAQKRGVYVSGIVRRGMRQTLFQDRRQIALAGAKDTDPSIRRLIGGVRQLNAFPGRAPQIRALVVDPFSTTPIVMTGSHGFGPRAARTNDENLIAVTYDRGVAIQCAATLEQIVASHRWRASAPARMKHTREPAGLEPDDTWQAHYFKSADRNRAMRFWTGVGAELVTAAEVPERPSAAPRTRRRKAIERSAAPRKRRRKAFKRSGARVRTRKKRRTGKYPFASSVRRRAKKR